MTAFVTGSRAYGKAKTDSDLDLVTFVSVDDLEKLKKFYRDLGVPVVDNHYEQDTGAAFVFGKLNLLCFTREAEFDAWEKATAELVKQRPVTRQQAVFCIKSHLAEIEDELTEAV